MLSHDLWPLPPLAATERDQLPTRANVAVRTDAACQEFQYRKLGKYANLLEKKFPRPRARASPAAFEADSSTPAVHPAFNANNLFAPLKEANLLRGAIEAHAKHGPADDMINCTSARQPPFLGHIGDLCSFQDRPLCVWFADLHAEMPFLARRDTWRDRHEETRAHPLRDTPVTRGA
jgi:hypothetical protein